MEKLIKQAKELLRLNLSEAYIESKMWSERNWDTGIRHICYAIQEAKKQI